MKGMVFNIQRFCVHDGPGIRTTVFVKGCPLRYAWCHNPESHRAGREILFYPDKCLTCGACTQACGRGAHRLNGREHAYERDGCVRCGECARVCYAGALEVCGEEMEASEALGQVLRDRAFFRDGGGMTISGGEPMMQFEFTRELLEMARREEISACMENSGYCATEKLTAVAPYVDMFLYDYKATDDRQHMRYTGVSNRLIRRNLKALSDVGARIVLRCPMIPEVNLTEEHFDEIARLSRELSGICEVELEPYHPLGAQKAERLGRVAEYARTEFMNRAEAEAYAERIRRQTDVPVKVQ